MKRGSKQLLTKTLKSKNVEFKAKFIPQHESMKLQL